MHQKLKLLFNIVIDGITIQTRISYNLNTNHIGIGNTFQYIQKYRNNNKNKIKENRHKYYEINRDSKRLRSGSKEHRIKASCLQQGIPIEKFNGFAIKKYCHLWTESFRQQIRNQYHNKCYLCGKEQDRKLSVHHVNYDKDCLCQKTCEFVPLCQSCHVKTNFNRNYWENLIMCYLYPNRYFMGDI